MSNNTNQKKRITLNYVYATLIGLLIIACAVTIAFVTGRSGSSETSADITTDDNTYVSATTYVVPMTNATIIKDYSAKKLQYNDTLKQWQIHKAIDLYSDESTDVMAIADGTVTNIYTNYLEGTVIEITHSDGLVSIYKSLDSDVLVSVGDTVTVGQVIGSASNSMAEELNTGVHLHLELTLNGVTVDPNDYLVFEEK